MADDLYGVLGVGKGASSMEIRKAYRKKALKHHPDRKVKAEAKEEPAEEVDAPVKKGTKKTAKGTTTKKRAKKSTRKKKPGEEPQAEAEFQSQEDIDDSNQEFKRVTEAYQVLIDPERRKRYDETGDTGGTSSRFDGVSEAEQLLVQMFMESLNYLLARCNPDTTELTKMVKDAIEVRRGQMNKAKQQGESETKKLRKVLGRLKFK